MLTFRTSVNVLYKSTRQSKILILAESPSTRQLHHSSSIHLSIGTVNPQYLGVVKCNILVFSFYIPLRFCDSTFTKILTYSTVIIDIACG